MRLLLSTLILVVLVNLAKAQGGLDSFSIKMYVSPMGWSKSDFVCAMVKRGNHLQFTYKHRDSVSMAYYQDKKTRHLIESYLSNPSAKTKDSIRSLEREYSYYREDSLTVSVRKYASFVELLKKIIATPKEALEDLEADKKLNVLDGASYSFQMQTPHGKTIVNTINLDSTLHPLLYRLNTEIMNIYKKEKLRDFFGEPLTSAFCNSGLIARGELNISIELLLATKLESPISV